MLYYSTNLKSPKATFSQALLQGQAPDRGLYLPESIPQLTDDEIFSFISKPYPEIAFEVSRQYLSGDIADSDLMRIVQEAYDFPVPLEPVFERKYLLRLNQGPTGSSEDFAARMMAGLMQYFLTRDDKKILMLAASPGGSGSALANAFYGLENIREVILFPGREVTDRQRKPMTSLGKNVQVIAIDGKFEDCQALVNKASADKDLQDLNVSSAHSSNIGLLIPRIAYYFYAFARLRIGLPDDNVIFSVPSGNFGSIVGGVMAMKMGLPVKRFIVAVNENNAFPVYLGTGIYKKVEPSRNCISNAMNVGHPVNLARLITLYGGQMDEQGHILKQADLELLSRDFYSISIDDNLTRQAIREAWEWHNVLLEPHGAVGWAGLQQFLAGEGRDMDRDQLYISLETDHPAKYSEEINRLLNYDLELPPNLQGLDEREEKFLKMENDYGAFKEYLVKGKW